MAALSPLSSGGEYPKPHTFGLRNTLSSHSFGPSLLLLCCSAGDVSQFRMKLTGVTGAGKASKKESIWSTLIWASCSPVKHCSIVGTARILKVNEWIPSSIGSRWARTMPELSGALLMPQRWRFTLVRIGWIWRRKLSVCVSKWLKFLVFLHDSIQR